MGTEKGIKYICAKEGGNALRFSKINFVLVEETNSIQFPYGFTLKFS